MSLLEAVQLARQVVGLLTEIRDELRELRASGTADRESYLSTMNELRDLWERHA
jgi:uncharacterized protein involved in exopolysaccharide biosynthesis